MTGAPGAAQDPKGPPPREQRWVQAGVLAVLVALALFVLRPFLVSMAWAVVLAFATWPFFRALERVLAGRTALAALCLTFMIVLVVVAPASMASLALAREAQELYADLRELIPTRLAIPQWVNDLPWVGPQIVERLEALRAEPNVIEESLLAQARPWAHYLAGAARGIGANLGKAGLALLILFFLYRHGALLLAQSRRVLVGFGGVRVEALLQPAGETIRAVMYGMLLTALAQGALAGAGYWLAGLGAPVLLAVTTALLAFIPFGAPVVYVPASAWLALVHGRWIAGLVLLIWGGLVVSTVDNLIRSWLISGVTRVPFLLVFFGVLGGLSAFGLIGLFIGPVVVTLLLILWREWSSEATPNP